MQLLLVNTNRMKPAIAPIGLDYLADALAAAGHTPRLLDLCFVEDFAADVERAARDTAPDLIGVTIRNTDDCYFSSQAFFLPEAKRVIELLRRASAAPIVLGGVGFSVAPTAALEYCGADFGIAGEGEVALLELVRALESGAGFADVSNLVYRDGHSIRQNPQRPVNLAALPPRRRTFVDNPRYFREGGQAGFETKRGCAMACVYCADPVSKGRSLRLLPPTQVVAELSALVEQGIDHFHACDSEFNLPPDHARAVCQAIIDAGLGERIRWYAYCSPAPFDEEMAALFQRAGGAGIDFGADSGADPVQNPVGLMGSESFPALDNLAERPSRHWTHHGMDVVGHDHPGQQIKPLALVKTQSPGHQVRQRRLFQPAFSMTGVQIPVHAIGIPAEELLLLMPGERAFGGQSLGDDLFALPFELQEDFAGQRAGEAKGHKIGAAFALEVRKVIARVKARNQR